MSRVFAAVGLIVRVVQFLSHISSLWEAIRNHGVVEKLPPLPLPADPPRLSVIIAMRNEENAAPDVVERFLRQDYPDLELILVNDRSTDHTGEILDRFARSHPGRVHVITVHELPSGWMGKSHAVWLAEQTATGEWLLLSDADAMLSPACCRLAMAYALRNDYDHLVLLANIVSSSYWAQAFALFWFNYLTTIWDRSYLVNDPAHPGATGWGPFNLVRRSVYQAVGTHAEIRADFSEDRRLGERIRWMGFRQHLLDGSDHFTLEWLPSLRRGLRAIDKNLFEGVYFSRRAMARRVILQWLLFLDPWVSLWRSGKLDRLLLLGTIAVQAAAFLFANRRTPITALLTVPTFPICAAINMGANIHSAWSSLTKGGVYWRGTFYPLEDMVRNRQRHVALGGLLKEEALRRREDVVSGP